MEIKLLKLHPWLTAAIATAIIALGCGACLLLNHQTAQQSSGGIATSQVSP